MFFLIAGCKVGFFMYFCKQKYNEYQMKKYILDLQVRSVEHLNDRYVLLKLTDEKTLPEMCPGQFVEVRVDGSPSTMLRRPISINFVDRNANELWLLVAAVGDGTRRLAQLSAGDTLNCVLPLGNGFTMPMSSDERILLVGGGVGVAPLLYFGAQMKSVGAVPTFLLGARSAKDLLLLEQFQALGRVFVTTEDGSMGERGFVTDHSILQQEQFTRISTCGPKPMMMAVARYAAHADIPCEASLENLMACGLGACLCCVEKTTDGNLCVCTDGPVFDTRRLMWGNENN
jgi:dihydroorotate dehydrogenase electron transfer subunit